MELRLENLSETVNDMAVLVTEHSDKEKKHFANCIMKEFEDFAWTDSNSGETNDDFESAYGDFIDNIRTKYSL